MRTAATLVCLCVLASPALVRADFQLVSPVSRYQSDSRTEGPCGFSGDARGADVTTVRAGSLLRVTWQETSAHPSHFRISFDADGQDDFQRPASTSDLYTNEAVLLDGISDTGGTMTADVRLPNVECNNCTLQLIQVLYDQGDFNSGGDDIHYQCADLVLSRTAPCEDGSLDGGACDSPSGADSDSQPGGDNGVGSDSDLGSDSDFESETSGATGAGYVGQPTDNSYGGQPVEDAGACSADRHRASRHTPWAVLALAGLALVQVARRRRG
jgi:hypothetical protein